MRRVAALLLALLSRDAMQAQNPRGVLPPPGTIQSKTLLQNWDDTKAQNFYSLPQGSKLIPYQWFLHLEQAGNNTPFRDAANIQALGYLARLSSDDNADGLPVGFTRDGDHLGFTCAACHTQQITFKKTAFLIDGAPTLADFAAFLRALTDSLKATVGNNDKFKRFADGILGAGADDRARQKLKGDVQAVLDYRAAYNARNLPSGQTPEFGPGRVDAIGAIFNEISSLPAGLPSNTTPANAPVSYPFLWDTPQHDFVQWNGSVENTESAIVNVFLGTREVGALGRNAGEVLGVFGHFDIVRDGFLRPRGYPSTVNKENLITLEDSLRDLWSPKWPVELGAIQENLRATGEGLFKTHCVTCHQPIDRTDPNRKVTAWLKASVGTDPMMARNFLTREVASDAFQGQIVNVPGITPFPARAKQADLLVHTVKRVLIDFVVGSRPQASIVNPQAAGLNIPYHMSGPVSFKIGENKLSGRFRSLDFEGDKMMAGVLDARHANDLRLTAGTKTFTFSRTSDSGSRFVADDGQTIPLDLVSPDTLLGQGLSKLKLAAAVDVGFIYKGRPLNGIWATAPYLHNGSVPNLDELLKKPANRIKIFKVGSREFDPVTVGFQSDQGTFDFKTDLPGNSNQGHDYGPPDREFTADERLAIIEYLKSL